MEPPAPRTKTGADSTVAHKAVSGIRWVGALRTGAQTIQWLITLVVIRLLSPDDYGLVAMAGVFLECVNLFTELGFESSIIQTKQELNRRLLQQVFMLLLIINLTLTLGVLSAAPLVAAYYREPEVQPILRVLSIQFLLSSFAMIPRALLTRSLQFPKIARIQFVTSVSGAILTLILAWRGFGVWALIWPQLFMIGMQSVCFQWTQPFLHRPILGFRGMRGLISFGSFIMAERTLWYLYTRADVLILGRLLGKNALGFYTVGKDLASTPTTKGAPIINQIAFPAFSRIQTAPEQLTHYFIKSVRVLGAVTFPISIGIALVAPEFIELVLGPSWTPVLLPMIVFSLIVAPRMLGRLMLIALRAVGRADLSLYSSVVGVIVMPTACIVGSRWGLNGVSVAWLLAYPICFAANLYMLARGTSISPVKSLVAMIKPGGAALLMVAAVLPLRQFLGTHASSLELLILTVMTGAVVYSTALYFFDRECVLRIKKLIVS